MAEQGSYQYECSRSELLGGNAPNQSDWEQAERARNEHAAMTVNFIEKLIDSLIITIHLYIKLIF